jgi:hypothetical protein
VMLHEGEALVTHFGIAKALSSAIFFAYLARSTPQILKVTDEGNEET